MTIDIRCLTYAIGLSQTSCECFEYPDLASRSDSGLYLDEFEPLSSTLVEQRNDCEKGSLSDLMEKARNEGIILFEKDLMNELLKRYKLKRAVFNGEVGQRIYNNNLNLSQNYAVVRMPVADVVSGYAEISSINTLFAEDGVFDLYVYNNFNELVDTLSLTSIANTYNRNPVSLELPLHSDQVENLEYFFVYESAGRTPKNNQLNCRSCVCPYTFNMEQPYWTMTPLQDGWEIWSMFQGCQLNSLDFMCLDSCYTSLYNMMGLTFDIKFKCKVTETICLGDGTDTGLDFEADVDALRIAEAIRMKSAVKLMLSILAAPQINRYVLANRETIIDIKNAVVTDYAALIKEIAETIDIHKNNDCLDCRDETGFSTVGIFS